MTTSFRSSLTAFVTGITSSVGTFLGLLLVCYTVATLLARMFGVSSGDVPVPGQLVGFGTLLAAAIGTGWLADGGYERLGADPDGGGTFLWLLVFVPLAFAPSRVALGFLTGLELLDVLFVLCTIVFAGWLAFYGGLERLGLAPDDFIRVFVYVIAFGVGLAVVTWVFDPAWLTDDRAAAAVATGVQIVACWLGFTTDVP